MKIIPVNGIIGWDIAPKDLRALLPADGEEIEIQIGSPGGFVLEGLEMFNLIARYPGKKTTFIMGEASSMASYISLAGDRVKAADNITFMIHNVSGGVFGDYRDAAKQSEILSGLSGLLARAYSQKSGRSIEDIRGLMDAETWYFGEEAKAAGFVDEIVQTTPWEKKDKESALAEARLHWAACRKVVGQLETMDRLTEAAAMAGPVPRKSEAIPPALLGAAEAAIKAQEVSGMELKDMTLEILSKERPDIAAKAEETGVQRKGLGWQSSTHGRRATPRPRASSPRRRRRARASRT